MAAWRPSGQAKAPTIPTGCKHSCTPTSKATVSANASHNGRSQALPRVDDLRVYYHTPRGPVKAVDGVSFSLAPHERFGLVGESGSGKTTIALALLRMIKPPGRIEGGRAELDGLDLLSVPESQMRRLRLAAIALVAQGAMNSLNPVLRVRQQIAHAIRDHDVALAKPELEARIVELLDQVGLA